jgi:hypothetical protein
MLFLATVAAPAPSAGVTSKVTGAITRIEPSKSPFSGWVYGDGIIVDALINSTEAFGNDTNLKWADDTLNAFLKPGTIDGYARYLLANQTIPWPRAIGDSVGLYPFAYLRRAEYYHTHPSAAPSGYNMTADIILATRTADQYILPWPIKWAGDGTVTRDTPGAWKEPSTGSHEFVWGDDAFMGLTLLSRLSRSPLPGAAARRDDYLDFAAKQAERSSSHSPVSARRLRRLIAYPLYLVVAGAPAAVAPGRRGGRPAVPRVS